LKLRRIENRGATLMGTNKPIVLLKTGNLSNPRRSRDGDTNDYFSARTYSVVGVNANTNRPGLYVAYPDQGENPYDQADIFLIYSTDGGTHWQGPQRINQDTSVTNDQWMPVLAVKPDGTQIFI
jgi:hypothetical protein